MEDGEQGPVAWVGVTGVSRGVHFVCGRSPGHEREENYRCRTESERSTVTSVPGYNLPGSD